MYGIFSPAAELFLHAAFYDIRGRNDPISGEGLTFFKYLNKGSPNWVKLSDGWILDGFWMDFVTFLTVFLPGYDPIGCYSSVLMPLNENHKLNGDVPQTKAEKGTAFDKALWVPKLACEAFVNMKH